MPSPLTCPRNAEGTQDRQKVHQGHLRHQSLATGRAGLCWHDETVHLSSLLAVSHHSGIFLAQLLAAGTKTIPLSLLVWSYMDDLPVFGRKTLI